MSRNELEVPYRSYDEIRKIADAFLKRYHNSEEIPVPIEHIIEFELDIVIIPIHGLKNAFDIDGFIANNFQSITVDLRIYNEFENRCRFTLAHEIGHMILHNQIWEEFEFTNTDEWKSLVTSFNTKQYSYLETQANRFAGLVLVPTKQLIERFDEAVERVASFGFRKKDNTELFNEYVCRWLSQQFEVAEQTVQIRLSFENLIKNSNEV